MITQFSKNDWLKLLACHALACFLFFSWFATQQQNPKEDDKSFMYTEKNSMWKSLDTVTFYTLNSSFKDSKALQTFWAVANNRYFDLVSAVLMIGLYIIFVLNGRNSTEVFERIKGGLYLSLWMLIGIGLFKLIFTFERYSPTKIPLDGALLLSNYEHIRFELKDASKKSFPGDHASVLLIVGFFVAYFARSWYKFIAVLIAVVFILPRIVGGGHWLTDIVIGGGCITLFTISWAIFSPFRLKIFNSLGKPALLLMKIFGKIIPKVQPPQIAQN